MKKVTSLRNSLPAVVNAITGSRGIKIVWQGPPRTDGNTIYSDPLPVDADEQTVKVIVGDIDHESSHILFSDFELLDKKQPSPLKKGLWNAFEDTVCERLMGDKYVGCQETLAESTEIALKQGHVRDGTKGPSDALMTFCDAWGRKNVLAQGVDPILESSRKELEKYLDKKGVRRLESLLSTELFSASSTEESFKLTEKVLKLVKDINDEQEEEKQKQQGSKNAEGKDQDQNNGQGSSQGNDDGNDGSDTGAGNQGDDDDSKGSDQNGDGSNGKDGDDKDSSKGAGGADDDTADQSDDNSGKEQQGDGAGRGGRAKEILDDDFVDTSAVVKRREVAEEMARDASYSNFTFDEKRIGKPDWGENLGRYNQLKSSVSGHIAHLQRRLAIEFMTRRHTRNVVGEEGRIDGRLLHRAVLGDPRFRRHKQVQRTPLPAVTMALDCSGSMGGHEIQLATQAVVALAEVCSTMNVPVEVVTFAGNRAGVVKQFDTPLQRARANIGAIGAGGGTPTAEGLWVAGNRLFNRKEERKILFLVTDGMANDMNGAKQVATMIENSGIEVYGVGIGTDVISQICTKSGVISHADDLADAILNALSERMFGAA